MKRRKRLEKVIESLKERIKEHEEKLEDAKEKGDEDLVRYYEKEIIAKTEEKEKKKEQFKKE